MLEAIIPLFAIFYLILAYYRLDWAVLAIVFGLPTYMLRFSVLGVPTTLLEIMILTAFAVWFIKLLKPLKFNFLRYLRDRQQHLSYPFKYEIILFLIISFTALATAHFSQSALGIFKAYFFEPLLVFILINNVFLKKGINKVLWALVFSALVVSLFAIYQKITGQFIPNEFWANADTRRVTSVFGFPNAVGLYLAPLVLVMIGFLGKRLKHLKSKQNIFKAVIITVTIILAVLSIYFAKSEGALVGVAAALFVYGIMVNRKMRIATIAATIIFIIGIVSYHPVLNYVKDKVTLNDLSGQIRKQQWTETKKMLVAGNWFWGTGLSGYQQAIAPYHQEGIFVYTGEPNWLEMIRTDANFRATHWQPTEIYMYPHNIFLNFWTELGLLGMILLVWLIGKYLVWGVKIFFFQVRANKNNSTVVLGLTTAMVAIVVHGLVDVPYFKNDLAVMFWLFFALLGLFNIYRQKHLRNNN
jgi:putative inorganic carbon (HCO3(-)) transporter